MSANGRLAASELSKVQGTLTLAKKTTQRYLLLKAAAKKQLGRTISIAQPAGAYRSYATQDAMHAASVGSNVATKRKWGLSTSSSVALATAGHSSHGTGTRVDIVGTAMDTAFLNLAAKYGFKREFGSADPNHFEDMGTYKVSVASAVKAAVTSKTVTVTIKSGDTLSALAESHHTTLAAILKLNPSIKDANLISIGQKVRVA